MCPTCKHAQQDVGQHGQYIAQITRDIAYAVQSERADQLVPAVLVGLYGLCSLTCLFLPHPFPRRDGGSRHFLFLFFPLFGFRFRLFLRFGFPSFHILQVGFLLSGSDNHRHVFIPFHPFPFLLGGFFPPRHISIVCFPPVHKIECYNRYLLLQLSVGCGKSRVFFARYACRLFAEAVEHVAVAAEHALADTLLCRERLRFLLPEMVGNG